MKKYFGTDGVRGHVGIEPMTVATVLRLGQAIGKNMLTAKSRKILIGCDTRESCSMLAAALSAGLTSVGAEVLQLGVITTPAVAMLTKSLHCAGGIMLSASHNPYHDNGIKCFAADGTKLSDEIEYAIEADLEAKILLNQHPGKITNFLDAERQYVTYCKELLPQHFSLKGRKIVIDCANGAGFALAPKILKEFAADVIAINNKPDGLNINAACGSTNVTALVSKVLAEQADLGMALDGDGDRIILVSKEGKIIDGDDILYVLASWYQTTKKLAGGVVGTVMSNLGLEQALINKNISFVRSKVGDRYVMQELLQRNWYLGGETSGHILCLQSHATGDGLLTGLRVLQALQELDTTLDAKLSEVIKYPQIMRNIKVTNARRIATNAEVLAAVARAEDTLAGKGRVLLRPSGTEPVVRIMVEGKRTPLLQDVVDDLATIVAAH